MNRIQTVLLLLLTLSLVCQAQDKKGIYTLGGTIRYNNKSSEPIASEKLNQKTTEFGINPRLGYFIGNNWQLGIGIDYNYYKNESDNVISGNDSFYEIKYTTSTQLLSFNPYLRYYGYIFDNFGIFTELSLLYGTGSRENQSNSGSVYITDKYVFDITHYAFTINPGIIYNINSKFALEASIGGLAYSRTDSEVTEPDTIGEDIRVEESFDLIFSLDSINFGIQYYF